MSSRESTSAELDRMLATGERVRWHGRPHRRATILGNLFLGIPLLFFVGPFAGLFFLLPLALLAAAIDTTALFVAGFVAMPVVVVLLAFGLAYLVGRRSYDHAEYAVTDRRLIAFSGVVGRDYSSVDWTNVQDFEVDVGLVGNRYGTGTVSAITAGGGSSGVQFSHVPDPYDVLDRLESVDRGEEA